jgi:hypothetical protein
MLFRNTFFKSRYGIYVRNVDGIKHFSERCLGELIRGVTKKSAVYREMNENLLVEKANLRMRQDELSEQPKLDAGEYFSVRRRLWVNNAIGSAVILAGVFLTYLAISAFIAQQTGLSSFLTWAVSFILAGVLMGGGLVATERFLEALLPRRTIRTEELKEVSQSVAPLWAVLLIGIELALLGIAEVRASLLSQSLDSNVLYYGFMVMTMILPIIAGAIRWDAAQFTEIYQTTQALRGIDSRLAQIDSILRQNEEYESNFYKMKSIWYWDLLNEFRTYKTNYNLKKGYEENIDGHFSHSYDLFQAEATKRYQSDIRDLSSTSMRKLSVVEKTQPIGGKMGQVVTRTKRALGNTTTTQSEDIYLSPQPIR